MLNLGFDRPAVVDGKLAGSAMTDERALVYAHLNFPDQRYCIVRDWIWVEFEMKEAGLKQFMQQGIYPVMIYAANVVHDGLGRWSPGSFVRTTALVSFRDGFIFQSRNTAYLLLGNGGRRVIEAEDTRTLH